MALLLFFGVIFMSYLSYKLLRRFIFKLSEYQLKSEVASLESLMSLAITTSAGRGVLWSEEVDGYRLTVIHSSSTAVNLPTNSHSSKTVDFCDQVNKKLLQ